KNSCIMFCIYMHPYACIKNFQFIFAKPGIIKMNQERIDQESLTALAVQALESYGLSKDHAARTAQILVQADMFGLHTHGVGRVQTYGERLDLKGINAQADIRIEPCGPAISKVDGINAVGPLVGQAALEQAMAQAREAGV